MNKRIVVSMVSVFLILSGCTTMRERQEKMEAGLSSWVGKDVNELIEQKGPPQQTYKMPNGQTIYTYSRESGPVTQVMYMGRMPMAMTNTFSCRIDFTVGEDNIIRTWRYEGNACIPSD